MSDKKPMGLLQYLALTEAEQDFYSLTGRLPGESLEVAELETQSIIPPKNKGGRPRKSYHINERRAYCLWLIAKDFSQSERAKLTNRKLIEMAHKTPFKGLFKSSQQTLEPSISRGKKTLKIDDLWNSKVCDLLEQDIRKLQR